MILKWHCSTELDFVHFSNSSKKSCVFSHETSRSLCANKGMFVVKRQFPFIVATSCRCTAILIGRRRRKRVVSGSSQCSCARWLILRLLVDIMTPQFCVWAKSWTPCLMMRAPQRD